ncbi:MAG TPA: hypothetical protein VGM25_10550 [Caulobacteraceae bacterium]|jgi:hypothetical protein
MTAEPPKKRLSLRMLSVAEIVGVAALAIAGLGYWDSHRERLQQDQERTRAEAAQRAAEADKGKAQAVAAQQEAVKHALLLTGVPAAAELRLQTTRPDQVIQTQTLWFPTEVRADSVATTGNPRIEARWIEDRLRRVAKPVDHQLPVAIETTFIEDGQSRTDRSLYLIGFSLHGRLVGGPRVEFEGLSLARRSLSGDPQAAANGRWIGR